MDAQNEALIGPNPRDVIIQEITRAKEKQAVIDKEKEIKHERTLFEWATRALAKKYFGLTSLECFDEKKIESLQDLIYEKARRTNIRHNVICALIPVLGWIVLIAKLDDCEFRNFPTDKFVKFYKKFRKQEEIKK